jgi:HEPN domain-containing protein
VVNKFSLLLIVQLILAPCIYAYTQGHAQWIHYASQDLKAAKILSQEDEIFSMTFFLCQQTAEKALKAFLMHEQQPFPKTHDLAILLNSCASQDHTFQQLDREVESLNSFGPDIRYPADLALPDKTTLEASIVGAEKIFKFVEDRLKK